MVLVAATPTVGSSSAVLGSGKYCSTSSSYYSTTYYFEQVVLYDIVTVY